MEDQEVLQPALRDLIEHLVGLVLLAFADQRPGMQQAAGDAGERVATDILELLGGSGIAALLHRLGADDEAREIIGRAELQQVLGDARSIRHLPVRGIGHETALDDDRVVPVTFRGSAEIAGGIVGPEVRKRLPAGQIAAGHALIHQREGRARFECRGATDGERDGEKDAGSETGFVGHEARYLRGRQEAAD